MVEIKITTRLAAPADEVWEHATTMEGVNYELMPLVRMSVPRAARDLNIADAPIGEVAFRSVLLAGSILPVDLHSLSIAEIGPDRRFLERSSSLMQRRWEHERTILDLDDGSCEVSDRLAIVPRLPLVAPIVRDVVQRIFAHRHRRLIKRFGPAA